VKYFRLRVTNSTVLLDHSRCESKCNDRTLASALLWIISSPHAHTEGEREKETDRQINTKRRETVETPHLQ